MVYLFPSLFALTSAVHLYDSWKDNASARAKTKPFLLLFLALFYISATKNLNIFLLLALITSWLGDVLLIPKGNKWFIMGGISFMAAHVFFILLYARHIKLENAIWPIVIPMTVIYYGISILVIRDLRHTTPKMMQAPMCFYLLCNSTMNLFALLQLMSHNNLGGWLTFIGAILFFVSDCSLFIVRYSNRPNIIYKKHFTVMLTYLLGEFLIVLGILQILG